MKPAAEKAKDLVNNFYQPLGYLKCGVNNTIMWEHAKKSALILVDEILSLNLYQFEQWLYQEVKKEIKKL